MDWFQAIFLALLQGVSELFPVSSLGHLVVVPPLLGWHLNQQDPTFVAFVVMLHLGTAFALLAFFWRDWVALISAWFKSLTNRTGLSASEQSAAHFAWLLIVGTIPVGLIGILFQKKIEGLFADPKLVCIFLIVNGFIMLGAEYLRRRSLATTPVAVTNKAGVSESGEAGRSLDSLSLVEGGGVGLAQALALLPGISRSGSAMAGGLLLKLNHLAAARFSFMLATPIILAAALVEVPKLFKADSDILIKAVVGAFVAGIAAYLSVRFLMSFFKTNRLDIFGYYCLAFGAIAFLLLQFVIK